MKLEVTLESVKSDFDHWRTTRLKNGPVPQYLRERALSLRDHHSRNKICTTLKIGHSSLTRWSKSIENKPDTEDAQPVFLPIEIPSINEATTLTKIEIDHQEGATMRLQGDFNTEQLVAIIGHFGGRQ